MHEEVRGFLANEGSFLQPRNLSSVKGALDFQTESFS